MPSEAAQLAMLGAALSHGCPGVFGRRFRGLPAPTVACAHCRRAPF